jgi:hypothetical protein
MCNLIPFTRHVFLHLACSFALAGHASSSWNLGATGFEHNITVPNLGVRFILSSFKLLSCLNGVTLRSVPARLLIPAAHVDDVTESGQPLSQVRAAVLLQKSICAQSPVSHATRFGLMCA